MDLHNSPAFTRRKFLYGGLTLASTAWTIPAFLGSSADVMAGMLGQALHQIGAGELAQYQPLGGQLLDHVGVILESPAHVDEMFRQVQQDAAQYGAAIAKPPKQHRDGSYSFYFTDPDGNVIQALYEPTLSRMELKL